VQTAAKMVTAVQMCFFRFELSFRYYFINESLKVVGKNCDAEKYDGTV
jgi:hypothetical protein